MRSIPSLAGAAVLAASALAACSGSSGSSVSIDQAASDAANALGMKFDSCTSFYITQQYGSVSAFTTRFKGQLSAAASASGSGWTGSALEQCVQAIGSASCDDVFGHNLPAACHPPAGQLSTGTACGDNSQCSSGYCNLGASGKCGTCAAGLGATGAPCYRDDDCAFGTTCENADVTAKTPVAGKCTAPAASGGVCNATQPCKRTLTCNSGVCGTPAASGASCSQDATGPDPQCNPLAGQYCSMKTGGSCTNVGTATTSQACGLVGGVFTECNLGGKCQMSSLTSGTCVAAAADFGTCNAQNGPACMPPAVCIASVCTLPTPQSCK